jgi:hypothetical protein
MRRYNQVSGFVVFHVAPRHSFAEPVGIGYVAVCARFSVEDSRRVAAQNDRSGGTDSIFIVRALSVNGLYLIRVE